MSLVTSLVLLALAVLPLPAAAWNISGHMLSAAIAYQVLQKENPTTIDKVKAVLKKHPWYSHQWRARLPDIPTAEHDQVLFMLAARWPDDIRIKDKQQNRGSWHYINWPFKPEGQPASVQTREPEPINILTAMAENESAVKKDNDGEQNAIALAWLFHLVGDIHQPLHTTQLFTVEYPQGNRGGNEICVRTMQAGPMRASSCSRTTLETAMESFEIATKITYRNGGRIGIPRGGNMDCSTVTAAPVLAGGYVVNASWIADRRMILAGYRLADLLKIFKP
jgi:hypothetical protein